MEVPIIYPSALNQYLENETVTLQPSKWGVYQIQEGDKTIVFRHEVIDKWQKRKRAYVAIEPYQLVTDGQSGKPIVVRLRVDDYNGQQFGYVIGFDEENHQGEVCSKCGKGIMLTDSAMVKWCNIHRNIEYWVNFMGSFFCPFILPFVCCFCCLASKKKRLCTNCNEEFEGKWGVCERIHSTKEDMTGILKQIK